MAYLGDVGIQLLFATCIACIVFSIGLTIATFTHGVPGEESAVLDSLIHIARFSRIGEIFLQHCSPKAARVCTIWYLSLSCALLTGGSYLCSRPRSSDHAGGAPYWHRHYHLHICTRQGERSFLGKFVFADSQLFPAEYPTYYCVISPA